MAHERETRLAYSTGGEVEATPRAPAAPQPRGATRLRLERRAAGRAVTVITGLPGNPDDVATLGRQLRSTCGTGGTVKDGVVELQGDQRDKVEAFLASRQIPSKRAGG
jgi:translation initiation factor 1